jgi:RNA polymerase sigma factor (TIGR02999 family)
MIRGAAGRSVLVCTLLQRRHLGNAQTTRETRHGNPRVVYSRAIPVRWDRAREAMAEPQPKDVTQLLVEWGNGDRAALDELTPLVYGELRRLASRYMRREGPGHTLQPSALVNEAFLRLVDQKDVHWQNRAHFFGVAAQLMRRVLIDSARRHASAKRGGGTLRVSVSEAAGVARQASEMIALDRALTELSEMDPRKGRIVEMKFFGGLTTEEVASVLGVTPRTVEREWRAAKAWLHRAVGEGEQHEA